MLLQSWLGMMLLSEKIYMYEVSDEADRELDTASAIPMFARIESVDERFIAGVGVVDSDDLNVTVIRNSAVGTDRVILWESSYYEISSVDRPSDISDPYIRFTVSNTPSYTYTLA